MRTDPGVTQPGALDASLRRGEMTPAQLEDSLVGLLRGGFARADVAALPVLDEVGTIDAPELDVRASACHVRRDHHGPELARAGEALAWASYDRIACPTLLLRGAQSDLLSAATAQAMTARGPKARLVEFAGIGHAPMLVQPEQIAVLQEFLTTP